MRMPLHFLYTQKSFGHSWMLFPKSTPATPSLWAAGLSHSKDGLVCRMGLSEHGVGWNFHGEGFGPVPSPEGLPELGTAIPTSPASCWNMFLKLSSMSSSVISSWDDANQKEEVSGQTQAKQQAQ